MRKVMETSASPIGAKKVKTLQKIDQTLNSSLNPSKEIKENYSRIGITKGYLSRKPK